MSSRLESCRVRVMLSATSDVSRLSIAPRIARINAASKTMRMVSLEKEGTINSGRPVGMAPNTGTSVNARLTTVPVINAASGPGKYRPQLPGQKNTMPKVRIPTPSAPMFGSITAVGTSKSAGMVPVSAGSWPNSRASCNAIMMQPIPLMNPETTG